MLTREKRDKLVKEYDIFHISGSHTTDRMHRGKMVRHYQWNIEFSDGTNLKVYVPHYFEEIGKERKIIKQLEKDKISKRSKKIINIKNRMT